MKKRKEEGETYNISGELPILLFFDKNFSMTIISEIIGTIRIAYIKISHVHNTLIFLWNIHLSSVEFLKVSYIEF